MSSDLAGGLSAEEPKRSEKRLDVVSQPDSHSRLAVAANTIRLTPTLITRAPGAETEGWSDGTCAGVVGNGASGTRHQEP